MDVCPNKWGDFNDGHRLKKPASIHPVRDVESAQILWKEYPNAANEAVLNMTLKLDVSTGLRVMTSEELEVFNTRHVTSAAPDSRVENVIFGALELH